MLIATSTISSPGVSPVNGTTHTKPFQPLTTTLSCPLSCFIDSVRGVVSDASFDGALVPTELIAETL